MNLKRLGGLLSLLALLAATRASAQEGAHPLCACKPREVGQSGSKVNWDGYSKSIRWHYSVEEALRIARAEGKLVFWYHLAGDLDKEGC